MAETEARPVDDERPSAGVPSEGPPEPSDPSGRNGAPPIETDHDEATAAPLTEGGGAQRDPAAVSADAAATGGSAATSDGPRHAPHRGKHEHGARRRFVGSTPFLILVALVVALIVKTFFVQAFYIPSESMEPTLAVGDRVFVNKVVYDLGDITRGDVIVFGNPHPGQGTDRGPIGAFLNWLGEGIGFAQPEDEDFIKRVVGLPGETVSIQDKKVFIDGTELREPYALWDDERVYPSSEFLPEPQRSRDQMKPLRLPAGQYFVMGDNRDHSNDSRYWGTVPRTMIKGRAFMVYWSFDWEPLPPKSTFRDRVIELVNVTRRFVSHTRWKRTFFIVDSQYHYTPGISSYGKQ